MPHRHTSEAASARIYDFALGGKDNYAADREAAVQAYRELPAARLLPRENRKFMRRAVRAMLDAGVRQFLDLGCGLPGRGNVHEVALAADPGCRTVYVDHDPVAVVHYQALLGPVPGATAVCADVREPAAILADPEVTALLDLSRPVGVLLIATLGLVGDDAVALRTVRAFRDALPPGGHLALCDFTDEALTPRDLEVNRELMRASGVRVDFRSREVLASCFDGLEPLPPGLVPAADWRPDRPHPPATGWLLAGVARKP
ncbi:SAM-dependent methyltransferase [Spirillospora sp. CA-253888]